MESTPFLQHVPPSVKFIQRKESGMTIEMAVVFAVFALYERLKRNREFVIVSDVDLPQYRKSKVGAPMNIIYWILGTLLIPKFWPF
jgi:hypothetical protein